MPPVFNLEEAGLPVPSLAFLEQEVFEKNQNTKKATLKYKKEI